jgi:hypothetical protein
MRDARSGCICLKAAFMKEENRSRMAHNTARDSHGVISSDSYEARTIILGNILHSTHPILPHRSDGGNILNVSTPVE